MKKSAHRSQAHAAISRANCPLTLEPLEQRTLYSADVAGLVAIQTQATEPSSPQTQEIRVIPESKQSSQASSRSSELIIVDSRVQNFERIIEKEGAKIVVVNADSNLFAALQLFQAENKVELTALHIIAHGTDGQLFLGNQTIDAGSIASNAKQWEVLGQALSGDADLLFYACDFAKTELGKDAVNLLASMTKADIAASTDASGAVQLGGDWELEFTTGSVQTATLFSSTDNGAYLGLLRSQGSVVSTPSATDTDAISYASRGATAAKLDDHRIVFVWENVDTSGDKGVFGRIQTDGELGAIFQISDTSNDHSEPSVAAGADGRFVVAWRESDGQRDDRILIRRYDGSGDAIGSASDVTPSNRKTTREEISVSMAPNDRIGIAYLYDDNANIGDQSLGTIAVLILNWDSSTAYSEELPLQSLGNYSSPAIMATSDNGFAVAAVYEQNSIRFWSFKPATITDYTVQSDTTSSTLFTIENLTIANDSSGRAAVAYRAYDNQGTNVIWVLAYDNEYLEGAEEYLSPLTPSLPGARSLVDPQLTSDGSGTFYLSAISSSSTSNRIGTGITGTPVYAKVENANSLSWTLIPEAPGFTYSAARTPEMLVDADARTFVFDANRTDASNVTEGSIQIVRTIDTDPAILVTSATGVTSEDGSSYTFGVKLSRAPTGTVTVRVESSSILEGSLGSGPVFLAFNASNWNVNQSITVYGNGRDGVIDSNQQYSVSLVASDTSADALRSFNGRTATVAMSNTNTDTRNSVTVTTADDTLHIGMTGNTTDLLAHMRLNPAQVSLRDVITAFNNSANGSGGSDQVLFSSTLQDQNIQLLTALPAITDAIEINGLAGKANGQGLNLTQDTSLSSAQADFTLINFANGSETSTLSHLAIGASKATNAEVIRIAANNVGLYQTNVGETSTQQAFANNTTAVLIQSTTGTRIIGAEIRNSTLTNSTIGVSVVDASSVTLAGNIISKNNGNGIVLDATTAVTIANNRIGTSSNGSAVLGNAGNGIYVSNSVDPSIISNTISGNALNGVVVNAGSGAKIKSNDIGLDATGAHTIKNNLNGILLQGAAVDVSIESNFISGNGEWGIGSTNSSNTNIISNTIGLNRIGDARGNGPGTEKDGVYLSGNTTNTKIKDNVIADNGGAGIRMVGSSVSNITVQSNHIGQDTTHTVYMNHAEGVALHGGVSDILIGGTSIGEGNHIAAPVAIRIFDGTTINSVSRVVYVNNETSNATGVPISVHTGSWTTPELTSANVNDVDDLDLGQNGLLNTPILLGIRSTGQGQYELSAQYNGLALTQFRIDYYLATNDVNGNISELAPKSSQNVTTDGTGRESWAHSITLPSALNTNQSFLATATRIVSGVSVETSILSDRPPLSGNQAPTIPAQDQTTAENSIWTYTPVASDLESDPIRWSLGSGGQTGLFSLTTNGSGQPILQFNILGLTLGQAPDFESAVAPPNNQYLVTLIATDSLGAQTTRTLQVSVTNVTEPPKVTSAAVVTTVEEDKTGFVSDLATSISVDSDSSSTGALTYAIVNDAATDGSLFSIVSGTGQLKLNSPLDFETPTDKDLDGYYSVRIKISDSNGLFTTQDIRVLVTDVRELANSFALPTPNVVAENSTRTWTLVGTDPDTTSTLEWSISGADASKFSINSSTGLLKLLTPLDYETMGTNKQLSIQITLTDTRDPATPAFGRTQLFLVGISDVPESPTISSTNQVNLDENQALNFTLLASDQDSTAFTYELDTTSDAAFFALDSASGKLTLSASRQVSGLNFESSHSQDYALRVRASDGSNRSAWQALTVRVNDVNEAPIITSPSSITTNEDTSIGFTASKAISFSDQDRGQTYTVKLSTDTGTVRFNAQQANHLTLSGTKTDLNAALAALQFEPSTDMNGNAKLSVTIQEDRPNGISASAEINITVKPIEDATTLINNTLVTAGKRGIALTPEYLKASDVDIDAAGIEYRLGTIDSKVIIKLSGTTLKVGDRFTQADIDAGRVTITPKTGSSGTVDVALSVYERGASGKAIELKFQVKIDLTPATTSTTTLTTPNSTASSASSAPSTGSATTSGATTPTKSEVANVKANEAKAELATPLAGSDATGMETRARYAASYGDRAFVVQAASIAVRSNLVFTSSVISNVLAPSQQAKGLEDRAIAATHEFYSQAFPSHYLGIPKVANTSAESRSVNATLFKNDQFVDYMNQLRDQVKDRASLEQVVVGSSVAVSTGISLGYVIWLLRGGALLTSLFASLPAWRTLDPFPVLAGVDDKNDSEDDSLQGMLRKAAEKFKTQKLLTEQATAKATG